MDDARASLVFFGIAASALAWRLTDPAHASLVVVLPCVPLFGSFAALCLRSFKRLRDQVAVNSDGIWYLPRKGEPTFIVWHEVGSVSALDTSSVWCHSTLQVLKLSGWSINLRILPGSAISYFVTPTPRRSFVHPPATFFIVLGSTKAFC